MFKGRWWFPDSLVGKFVVLGLLLGGVFVWSTHSEWKDLEPVGAALMIATFLAVGVGAGLLLFGALIPLIAMGVGMRQAGFNWLQVLLGYAAFAAFGIGVFAAFAYFHYIPDWLEANGMGWVNIVASIAVGVGMLWGLPNLVTSMIRDRKTKQYGSTNLPTKR